MFTTALESLNQSGRFTNNLNKTNNTAAGAAVLFLFSFCGSGAWCRSIQYFAESQDKQCSRFSAIADDMSDSHVSKTYTIYSRERGSAEERKRCSKEKKNEGKKQEGDGT